MEKQVEKPTSTDKEGRDEGQIKQMCFVGAHDHFVVKFIHSVDIGGGGGMPYQQYVNFGVPHQECRFRTDTLLIKAWLYHVIFIAQLKVQFVLFMHSTVPHVLFISNIFNSSICHFKIGI